MKSHGCQMMQHQTFDQKVVGLREDCILEPCLLLFAFAAHGVSSFKCISEYSVGLGRRSQVL